MLLPECTPCLQIPTPAASLSLSSTGCPGFSLQACRGAEGAAATAPALSQGQPALLPHGRGPHLSQTHALGLFPEYTRTVLLLAAAVPHDLPVCRYLLTLLVLISASTCVCSSVYEHGAFVCECVYGCAVALVWRSQSLRVPVLLSCLPCHSGNTEARASDF